MTFPEVVEPVKNYQLILLERNPETHKLQYILTCNDEVIAPECTYQKGYSLVAKLMSPDDSFQEIENGRKSVVMSYSDVLQGYHIMNINIANHDE